MQIKTYKGSKIPEACRICLQNKLYVDGWSLKKWYENNHIIYKILIGFVNDKPIGCLVVLQPAWSRYQYPSLGLFNYYNLGIYIKQEYRRQKYGTKLMNRAINQINPEEFRVCDYFNYQYDFFKNFD